MTRPATLWLIPVVICLALYWPGLTTFFQQDDFAWLSLSLGIQSPRDFWRAMFAPMAQGTIRPWSERAFFMGFFTVFGLDPLPFRIAVFLTQFANLALILGITRRLTGSAAAGAWAAVFWICNSVLVVVMSWSSVYNQSLCALFLLAAFYCFLRGWYGRQWIAFLLGFGALEINVVYPAIVTSYTLLLDRGKWKKTTLLWIPSIVFFVIHRAVAPDVTSGPYLMHVTGSMLGTLGKYWMLALGPTRLENLAKPPEWIIPAATAVISLGLVLFLVSRFRLRDPLPLFFLGWFLITLGPVLPLRDHVSEYYLTIPSIGLAMLSGWAVTQAVTLRQRLAGAIPVLVYLAFNVPIARIATQWNHDLAKNIERLMGGVAQARELHPGKTILLHNVSDDLFYTAILDKPFRLIRVQDVYLTPESQSRITPKPELGLVSEFTLPASATLAGLAGGNIVVYDVSGHRLRNITRVYEASATVQLKAETPRRIDVGNAMLASQLGPGWHAREGAYRWMGGRATVRIGGPRSAQDRLYLTGFYPAAQLENGALAITVTIDGARQPPVTIQPGMERFDFDFALPPALAGKPSFEVVIEPARTFRPPADGRDLGLAFGVFEVR